MKVSSSVFEAKGARRELEVLRPLRPQDPARCAERSHCERENVLARVLWGDLYSGRLFLLSSFLFSMFSLFSLWPMVFVVIIIIIVAVVVVDVVVIVVAALAAASLVIWLHNMALAGQASVSLVL